jgi:5-methylcytosine-specific restriction endonuclease McrA
MGISWTEGRLKGFITTALRSAMRRYPPKYECINAAYVGKKINKKSGRSAKHYKCNKCKGDFPSTDINVDHIDPVVSNEGFVDWNTFIERLFCKVENLQVLCIECHKQKSKEERNKR